MNSRDFFYIAGFLSNKPILKMDKKSCMPICAIYHHSKTPLELIRGYFGGKLGSASKKLFILKVGGKKLEHFLGKIGPYTPYFKKTNVALELIELKKTLTKEGRLPFYDEISNKFNLSKDNHIPKIPNEFLGDYIGGVLDDNFNCFIYPGKEGKCPTVTLAVTQNHLLDLLDIPDKINVKIALSIINLWSRFMRDSGARAQQFAHILASHENLKEKWSLRNE